MSDSLSTGSEAAAVAAPGRARRLAGSVVGLFGLLVGLVVLALNSANAYAVDCVPAADNPASCMQDGAKSWITTYGIPAVGALILVASLFFLGVRWYRKGNAQAH